MARPQVQTDPTLTDALKARLAELFWRTDISEYATWWSSQDDSHDEALLDLAWLEGIFPDVYAAYRTVRPGTPRFEERLSAFEQGRERIRDVVAALPPGALVVKGLGIEALYPPGRRRYSTDCDIVVESTEVLWDLHPVMLNASYDEIVTLLRRDVTGEIHGAQRWYPKPALLHDAGEVEVQVGGFMISDLGADLPWSAFAREQASEAAGGVRVPAPAPMGQLLVMLAEFETRERAKMRDIFDWHVVAGRLTGEEVARVVGTAERYGIRNAFRVLGGGLLEARPFFRIAHADTVLA
ncbi:MAG: hypothetical protein M3O36_15045, partial [Myxococcota bacterium]|nr:hypothetical protein [Myxococcota bacterium]